MSLLSFRPRSACLPSPEPAAQARARAAAAAYSGTAGELSPVFTARSALLFTIPALPEPVLPVSLPPASVLSVPFPEPAVPVPLFPVSVSVPAVSDPPASVFAVSPVSAALRADCTSSTCSLSACSSSNTETACANAAVNACTVQTPLYIQMYQWTAPV